MSEQHSEFPVIEQFKKLESRLITLGKYKDKFLHLFFFNLCRRLSAYPEVIFKPDMKKVVYVLLPYENGFSLLKVIVDTDNRSVIVKSSEINIWYQKSSLGTGLDISFRCDGPSISAGYLNLDVYSSEDLEFLLPVAAPLGLEFRLESPIVDDVLVQEVNNIIADALREAGSRFQRANELLSKVWSMLVHGKLDMLHIFKILEEVVNLYIDAYHSLAKCCENVLALIDLLK